MAFRVPSLATEVAKLPANGGKAGDEFSTRERAVLASAKAYMDGLVPSHKVVAAGKRTATASATQAITVSGVLATDIVHATVESRSGAGVAYILRATPTASTVTIVGSASFDAGDIISWSVLRAI